MPFKNFQAQTEEKKVSQTYKDTIDILLLIQRKYPLLYLELNKDPQFEYDIEIYRKHPKFEKAYFSWMKEVIFIYEEINKSAGKRNPLIPVNVSILEPINY